MWRYTALLILIYTGLVFGIYGTWKKREQEIFARHSDILKTSYNTTIHLYKTYTDTLYEEVIDRPEILRLIDEAYTSSPEQQAILRGRLYRMLYPAYTRLHKRNLRQLHFQFPDNSSFIRFHRLEKFGDSLTDIRESIRLVNEQHEPIFGFENGRVFSGFRYVFPLRYQQKHIGSVETSVSFKAFRNAMHAADAKHDYLFLQKKNIVMAKSFPADREIYKPLTVTPDYVVEDLRILGLEVEDPLFPLARRLNPKLGKNKEVQDRIRQGLSFAASLHDHMGSYLITGLPVRNIKGKQVAYIISYEENNEIPDLWSLFKVLILGLTILILLLSFFIWEHQAAVTQLKRNEARLQAITQSMGDALYVNDRRGKILFSNRAMEKQLGYLSEELVGQDAHKLFHRHKQENTLETLEECQLLRANMEGSTFENAEDFFLHKNGSLIPVEVKGSPLQLQHGKRGSVVIFRDITERLQTENNRIKAKKLESIGVLAGGIAHDFNNLLTTIMGNIELTRMLSKDRAEISQLLQEAMTACKRATRLTNQLHTFSEAAAPVTAVVDLQSFLLDIVQSVLANSSIRSELIVDDDLWPVQMDTDQIRQAFQNILTNSIEAMGPNGIITINCHNHQGTAEKLSSRQADHYVRIDIHDTGCGIASRDIDKIFDPYFSSKGKGSIKGSGLGLAIVHSIIKRHNGYIELESTEGKGTTFTIYLPAVTGKGGEADNDQNCRNS